MVYQLQTSPQSSKNLPLNRVVFTVFNAIYRDIGRREEVDLGIIEYGIDANFYSSFFSCGRFCLRGLAYENQGGWMEEKTLAKEVSVRIDEKTRIALLWRELVSTPVRAMVTPGNPAQFVGSQKADNQRRNSPPRHGLQNSLQNSFHLDMQEEP